jgi:hypothetical protein
MNNIFNFSAATMAVLLLAVYFMLQPSNVNKANGNSPVYTQNHMDTKDVGKFGNGQTIPFKAVK